MINALSICLQAIHVESNLFRQYEIHLGKDLLGAWILTTAYGRIGKSSKTRIYAFESLEDIAKKTRQILIKRLHSFRRIGTQYRIIDVFLPYTDINSPISTLIHTIKEDIEKTGENIPHARK